MWINVRVFNLIPLVQVSVSMPIPSCFHYWSSIIELVVWDGNASRSSFIIQDCFSYSGFFVVVVFLHEVDYCSFQVCEELCWDLDGDCIESVDCFW